MNPVRNTLTSLYFIGCCLIASALYVFKGDPYSRGPLAVQQLTLTKIRGSPVHTVAFLPSTPDEYAPVFFIGGWRGFFPAGVYSDVLTQIASHGFAVFGADPYYPALDDDVNGSVFNVGAKIPVLFRQLDWLRGHMANRTGARIAWDYTVLACHSAGCDSTLQMIQQKPHRGQGQHLPGALRHDSPERGACPDTSVVVRHRAVRVRVPPVLQKGADWRQFYKIFSCPRMLMEVKGFGHCDILDDKPWQVCHDTKFCTTTNKTRNSAYHQFVQGIVSAFLTGTLENYEYNLRYILNYNNIPLQLLDLQSDLIC